MSTPLVQNLYRIDRDDRIVSVDPSWDRFAISNDAPELEGGNVIERSLWDFVSDELTRHIYQQMIAEVRDGRSLNFDFRCDSPDQRRFLGMRMTPTASDGVKFETVTYLVEERGSQDIYRRSTQFSGQLVITCSWCKRIRTAENSWHEIEQAVQLLELFELTPPPQVSHGMCEKCYDVMMEKFLK